MWEMHKHITQSALHSDDIYLDLLLRAKERENKRLLFSFFFFFFLSVP